MQWQSGAALAEGFALGMGLIVAIGAQNAFVLRQGILREHVLAVTTLCFLSDAVLIALGVGGFASIVRAIPGFTGIVRIAGAVFLAFYGLRAFVRAARPDALLVRQKTSAGLGGTMLATLALTWLNPHVYLDTIVLLGGLSARFAGSDRLWFGIGAALASAVWFYALGYGARVLAPLFAKPAAWRALDIAIGCVMWAIGISLLRGLA